MDFILMDSIMDEKPWRKSPATLHYVYYEMPDGKVKKFLERGDMVDRCIERLGWAQLKVLRVEKKRET